jgi:hypothetical protein
MDYLIQIIVHKLIMVLTKQHQNGFPCLSLMMSIQIFGSRILKNMQKCIQTLEHSCQLLLMLTQRRVFAGFTNEATFAANFTQEMGILTNDILHDYQNFQTSGIILKKDIFIEVGGFKPSVKLTFGYEFLLRLNL